MHAGSTTLLLVGVAVVGTAPLLILVFALVRRSREREPRGRSDLRARALPVSLVGVAVLALSAAWYVDVVGGRPADPSDVGVGTAMTGSTASALLPRSLAGLRATDGVTGPEAVQQVSQLHGADFPIVSAEIATYEGSGGTVTVWVARSADEAGAADMTGRMAERISEGGSPFDPPRPLAGERGVWVTHGMGQVHYFFARGDAVWWLSADPGVAREALARVLEGA